MPRLQVKAQELVNTDVNFIALVKRGANRIPFRITKEDEPMLDLHKIGRSLFKKADPKPEIVAAVVQKGVDLNRVAQIFKAAGLDPKQYFTSEKEGIITVAKADAGDAQDTAVLKVSDEIGLVVSGLKKAFDGYAGSSSDFNVVMATEGVYPSMCIAKDALGAVIGNILYKAASPAEASAQVAAAADAFKEYMTTLLSAVPEQAFKLDLELSRDGAVTAQAPAEEAPAEEATDLQKAAGKNGTGAGFEAGKGTGTTPKATADDAANTAVNAKPGEKTTGNDGDDLPKKAKKEEIAGLPQPDGFEPGDGDGFAAAPTDSDAATARASADDKKMRQNGGTTGSSIPDGDPGLARLGGVRKEGDADVGKKGKGNKLPDDESGAGQAAGQEKDLKDVSKSDNSDILDAIAELRKSFEGIVESVRAEVGELGERVEQVTVMARKTDAALNGTVFNEVGGDAAVARKKSEVSEPPLLDTAYNRRNAA